MPVTAREKMRKKFKVKEIKGERADRFLRTLSNLKISIGLYRKETLIGVCNGYAVTKKEFKKWKYLTKYIDSIMMWDVKIIKKYNDEEMRMFFDGERYKLSRKKFPKTAYCGKIKKSKKKKAS